MAWRGARQVSRVPGIPARQDTHMSILVAPASCKAADSAVTVAPDVMTSSTSATARPATRRGSTWNTPRTFDQRLRQFGSED